MAAGGHGTGRGPGSDTVAGVRQLFPVLADPTASVDPVAFYLGAHRPAPSGRPWVAVGMVASVDGATAVGGVSGALGGDADRRVFRAVRAIADVIVVGAGTVRAEDYGPVTLTDAVMRARQAAGRPAEPPRLAVVSASLDLDDGHRIFSGETPPLILTVDDAPSPARRRLESVAEVVVAGTGRVELTGALRALSERGATVAVCEGGPGLVRELVTGDLVDEWCLNVAATIVGGGSDRVVAGGPEVGQSVELASLLADDDLLAVRWLRRRSGPTSAGA